MKNTTELVNKSYALANIPPLDASISHLDNQLVPFFLFVSFSGFYAVAVNQFQDDANNTHPIHN